MADTLAGKILSIMLMAFYVSLITLGAGGEWYALTVPAGILAVTALQFCYCLIRGYKIPSPGLWGWLAMGLGGGYFFIRAWLSPWYYESLSDLGLIVTAAVMFTGGLYAGANKGEKSKWPWLVAVLGVLNVGMLFWQNFTGDFSSVFRPDYSLSGQEISNIGLFGYKNFSCHWMCICGFFLSAWCLAKEKKNVTGIIGGLLIAAVSLTCNSEAAYLNLIVGVTLCFFIYTTGVYHQTAKFYTAAVLFILLLFCGATYVLYDLSIGSGKLDSTLTVFRFGSRIDLAKLAWEQAELAPLFGHGSQMFSNLAMEYFWEDHYPNFAHHEYAQAACDYGYTGLALMLGILALIVIMGVRCILRLAGDRKMVNPLGVAACSVPVLAMVHAYGEFIWHNPALIGAVALCAGIVCTAGVNQVKACGTVGRLVQVGAAIGVCVLSVFYVARALPVWQASLQAVPASSAAVLPMLDKATAAGAEPKLVHEQLIHELSSKPYPSVERLKTLESLVERAEQLCPGSHSYAVVKAILYMNQRRYEAAEKTLRPYVMDVHRFYDLMYAWKTIYMDNLCAWAKAIYREQPGKALSMYQEAYDLSVAMRKAGWAYYGARDANSRKAYVHRQKEMKMTILILQSMGQAPDSSWKK